MANMSMEHALLDINGEGESYESVCVCGWASGELFDEGSAREAHLSHVAGEDE